MDLRNPLALPDLAERAQQVGVSGAGDGIGVAGALAALAVVALLLAVLAVSPVAEDLGRRASIRLRRMSDSLREIFRRRPRRRISGPRAA